MDRPTRRAMILAPLLAVMPASTVAWSQQQVAGQTFTCDDGAGGIRQYWMFAQGDDASCRQAGGGVFECRSAATGNESRGGCETGCIMKTGYAGCHLVLDDTQLIRGVTDLECPDGRVYRLEDGSGSCDSTNNRKPDGKAECRPGGGIDSRVTVSASCANGCGISRPGTSCTCVEGCGRPDGK